MNDFVEQMIRDSVTFLERRPGGWVSLTRLRNHIPAMPRESIDAALRSMIRQPGVHLIPESNQKALTDADRAAALVYADELLHLIAIERRS